MGYPPHNVDLVEVEEDTEALTLTPIEQAERERQMAKPWQGLPVDPSVQSQADEWREKLPRPWMLRYVMTLAVLGTQSAACLRARVSRSTILRHRDECPAFAQACAEAEQIAIDGVEAALTISATVGDPEPVYQQGVLVGHKRVKSVKAAISLMEAHRPQQWRKGDTGAAVNVGIVLPSQDAVADVVRQALASGHLSLPVAKAVEAQKEGEKSE